MGNFMSKHAQTHNDNVTSSGILKQNVSYNIVDSDGKWQQTTYKTKQKNKTRCKSMHDFFGVSKSKTTVSTNSNTNVENNNDNNTTHTSTSKKIKDNTNCIEGNATSGASGICTSINTSGNENTININKSKKTAPAMSNDVDYAMLTREEYNELVTGHLQDNQVSQSTHIDTIEKLQIRYESENIQISCDDNNCYTFHCDRCNVDFFDGNAQNWDDMNDSIKIKTTLQRHCFGNRSKLHKNCSSMYEKA